MAEYDNTNSGMARKNRDKREGKKDSEYRGSINVEGREYWLDIWINEGGPSSKMPGEKYLSLKIKPKDAPKPAAPPPKQAEMPDDDIPF